METVEQEDEKGWLGFFRRRSVVVVLLVGAMLGVVIGAARIGSLERPILRERTPELRTVRLPPPPPPQPRPQPLPRPEPAPAPEQMVEQPAVENETKPAEDQKAPTNESVNGPLGTNVQGGDGSDSFGLSGSGSGNGLVGGGGAGLGGGSRWGWYASKVQTEVQAALMASRKTRYSSLHVTVRLWTDPGGRVVRARLARSTGDAALDEALQKEVLGTLVLSEPPPSGMPMPIVLRITGGPAN